jgi:glycerophosphoryl diester phosphodiesterase
MRAFQGAADLGFGYVETDVHTTIDGVMVAFHDDRLDRVTDRKGVISELPWAEVRLALVDGLEPIPRFEELVLTFPDLRINIDPKADNSVGPLISAIGRHDLLDRVCVGSFSDARLAVVHESFGPDICLGMGRLEVARLRGAASRFPIDGFRARCAQVPVKQGLLTIVDDRFVKAAHERNISVQVWTVDEAAEMRRLLDLGVDAIMTDQPKVLRDVLTERGEWT